MYSSEKEAFAAACHKAAGTFALMTCSSGNMSWRVSDEHILISASRSWMGELTTEQIVVMQLSDGTIIEGDRPSVESRFHLGTLRLRDEMRCVLHFQSPFATQLCCREMTGVNLNMLPEVPYYIGPIGLVPYLTPGTEELATAVIECMQSHNLALLRNHGLVTTEKTMDLAIQNAVFFELNARMIVEGGGLAKPLTADAVAQLRSASMV